MSTNSKLVLNSKWSIQNLITVMKNHCDIASETITVKQPDANDFRFFQLYFTLNKETRMFSIFTKSESPLGTTMVLYGATDEDICALLIKIATVLGGFIQPTDSQDTWNRYKGMFQEEDCFPYFLKNAILENSIVDSATKANLVKFKESIANWHTELNMKWN